MDQILAQVDQEVEDIDIIDSLSRLLTLISFKY